LERYHAAPGTTSLRPSYIASLRYEDLRRVRFIPSRRHASPAFFFDIYYKRATDQLDDGQFGPAVVLEQFNYARGFSRGAEAKVSYYEGGFRAYANVSHEITMAKDVNSKQYIIGDPVELAYLASSVINLFDRIYLLRSATGVGEFAPQYGPRRGGFIQLTQQF
jgi:hypothetical protein